MVWHFFPPVLSTPVDVDRRRASGVGFYSHVRKGSISLVVVDNLFSILNKSTVEKKKREEKNIVGYSRADNEVGGAAPSVDVGSRWGSFIPITDG